MRSTTSDSHLSATSRFFVVGFVLVSALGFAPLGFSEWGDSLRFPGGPGASADSSVGRDSNSAVASGARGVVLKGIDSGGIVYVAFDRGPVLCVGSFVGCEGLGVVGRVVALRGSVGAISVRRDFLGSRVLRPGTEVQCVVRC